MDINDYLAKQTKLFLLCVSFVSLAIIGTLDYITGYEIGISVFYLAPISLVAWYIDARSGFAISFLRIVVMLIADIASGMNISNYWVEAWNLSVHFGFFILVVFLILIIKIEMEERRKVITKLQKALDEVRVLHEILSICASCKKIKDASGKWVQIEQYISTYTGTQFSHGICPKCAQELYPEFCENIRLD